MPPHRTILPRRPHRPLRSRRALVLLTALTAAAAVILPTSGAVAAKPVRGPALTPSPVVITVAEVRSEIVTPETLGAPDVFVATGEPVALDVEFTVDGTPAAISENKEVTLTVSVTGSSLALGSTTSLVVPRGATGGTVEGVVLGQAANGVSLTVTATAPVRDTKDVEPGHSAGFDVAKDFHPVSIESKGGVTVSSAGVAVECEAIPERPICADLVLPVSELNGDLAFFSTGVCSPSVGCRSDAVDVLQVLARFALPKDDPATIIVKCDKTLCGGGAIKRNELLASLDPSGALVGVPACAAKGVINTTDESCVDYVQSKRDGSGDTYLYWLVPRDARFSI